jgi:hypothetical protein
MIVKERKKVIKILLFYVSINDEKYQRKHNVKLTVEMLKNKKFIKKLNNKHLQNMKILTILRS